jgi:parallel beta-helix repeat protein
MEQMTLACTLLAVMLLGAAALEAATIHVSPTGNDSADGKTPRTALRSPQAAHDRCAPGDSVLFAVGEYVVTEGQALLMITRSGRADAPIRFAPAEGQKVVLRSRGAWQVIKVAGASHIVIEGFELHGMADQVTLREAQHEMNNLNNPRTCGNGIGIVDGTGREPSSHVTVRNCIVEGFGGGGIFSSHCDYIIIENNTVSRCGFWAPYGNSGISVYQPVDVDDNTADHKIIIRNNVCFENYNHIPFYYSDPANPAKRKVTDGNGIILDDYRKTQAFGGARPKAYGGRTLVANNVLFDNGGSGIHAFVSTNVDIVFNYAAGNNSHPQLKDGQIFANSSKGVRIVNNILVAPPGKPVNSDYRNDADVVYDYNVYASADGTTPAFTRPAGHNILADPQITLTGWAEGKRDVTADAGSPLRGAASPLEAVGTDFFGRPRPASLPPDIGPFQLAR